MTSPENLARLAAYARSPEGRAASAQVNYRHGLKHHPLYGTWCNIKTRCYNPNFRQFQDWGGRGITLCDTWHDPEIFIRDIERLLGPRPDGMTLDRIDNDGNYEPGNVRWATRAEQRRNSRGYIDGRSANPLYRLWWRINHNVCDAWRDPETFIRDVTELLGPRPEGQRFDRIDDSLPYGPGNAAWVTGAQQVKRAQAKRWS